MNELKFEELLDAGCHFGHLKRKWNPKMAPYIFKEHNGIHVIDLQKTIVKADEAAAALKQMAKSGKKVLFVATKHQLPDHPQGCQEDEQPRPADARQGFQQYQQA